MLCISTQAEDLQGTRHYLAIQSLFCSKKYIRNSNSIIIIIIIIVDIKTIVTTINRIQNLLEIHFVFYYLFNLQQMLQNNAKRLYRLQYQN